MERPVGQTKDMGFQFGLRKTVPFSANFVWEFLFSEAGLNIWLGELQTSFKIGQPYITKSGIEGFIRVFRPYSHVRLNWKKKHWNNYSTLQLRVIEHPQKTTISFHQEKLFNSEQRSEMKIYWNDVMDKITETMENRK